MPAWGRERGQGPITHRDVSLMSAAERKVHQERMRSIKTYDECTAYMNQHREQMTTRAAQKGRNSLAQIRRVRCIKAEVSRNSQVRRHACIYMSHALYRASFD